MAFHNYRGHISAEYDGFPDRTTDGRRPTGAYIPRFRNLFRQDKDADFLRGYAAGFSAFRPSEHPSDGVGETLKAHLASGRPGPWRVGSHMMGETIPKATNQVSLDDRLKDEWGIPQLKIDIGYDENDERMLKDFFAQMTEMYAAAGFTNIRTGDSGQAPGLDIHEMGGV